MEVKTVEPRKGSGDMYHPMVVAPMLAEHHLAEIRAARIRQQSHGAEADRRVRKMAAALRMAYQSSAAGMDAVNRLEAEYEYHNALEDAVLPRLEVSAPAIVTQIVQTIAAWFSRVTGTAEKKTALSVRALKTA